MPPKKAQKMSLSAFLGSVGETSWADEMEAALPTAPAQRTEEDRSNDRYSRRDDFLSSRPDRPPPPHREDLPLPTSPPFTAFIGNLAFDLTEADIENFFSPLKTKSIKIIKDREDKPKGFGYVEFEELEDLKSALTKSGSSFSSRTVRISVAEPPKERSGHHGDEESKFDNPWRREGPLESNPRETTRRRFDSTPNERAPGLSDEASDWRSSRPRPVVPEAEPPRSRGTGFASSDNAADREETWSKGSKFKPSVVDEGQGSRFSGSRRESSIPDEGDWRSNTRPKVAGRNSTSPNSSVPSTPQLGRRKLELLPRSGGAPSSPSSTGPSGSTPRPNPFGTARPVDVTSREQEVADRLAKEREANKDRPSLSMSRTNSRAGSERSPLTSPPVGVNKSTTPSTPSSPKFPHQSSTIRPSFSFANAASSKEVAN